MTILCRLVGHSYVDWIEWHAPELPGPDVEVGRVSVRLGPTPAIPNYRGQRCERCGEQFGGMTCRPAYPVHP